MRSARSNTQSTKKTLKVSIFIIIRLFFSLLFNNFTLGET